jgi:hypothetical protein
MSANAFLSPGGKWLNKKTGIFDKFSDFFTGNKDEFKQLPTQNPEQQQFLKQIFGQLSPQGQVGQNYGQANDYLSKLLGGDRESFERFAAPHRTQFEQQTIPRLAERFSAMGGGLGGGVESSSGFGQAIGGAGAQFESNLAGLYAQLQQQAAQQAMGQYNQLGGRGLGTMSFENAYFPGTPGLFGNAAAGFAQGAGQSGNAALWAQLLPLLMGA